MIDKIWESKKFYTIKLYYIAYLIRKMHFLEQLMLRDRISTLEDLHLSNNKYAIRFLNERKNMLKRKDFVDSIAMNHARKTPEAIVFSGIRTRFRSSSFYDRNSYDAIFRKTGYDMNDLSHRKSLVIISLIGLYFFIKIRMCKDIRKTNRTGVAIDFVYGTFSFIKAFGNYPPIYYFWSDMSSGRMPNLFRLVGIEIDGDGKVRYFFRKLARYPEKFLNKIKSRFVDKKFRKYVDESLAITGMKLVRIRTSKQGTLWREIRYEWPRDTNPGAEYSVDVHIISHRARFKFCVDSDNHTLVNAILVSLTSRRGNDYVDGVVL